MYQSYAINYSSVNKTPSIIDVAVTRTETDCPGDRIVFLLGGLGSPFRILNSSLDFRQIFYTTCASYDSPQWIKWPIESGQLESSPACQDTILLLIRTRALFTGSLLKATSYLSWHEIHVNWKSIQGKVKCLTRI